MRQSVAKELGLNAEEVWYEIYLQVNPKTGRGGFKKVNLPVTYDPAEWEALDSSRKIRSLLLERGMTLRDLALYLDVSYTTLTKTVYGGMNVAMRERINSFLDIDLKVIWPARYNDDQPSLAWALDNVEHCRVLLGLGNLQAVRQNPRAVKIT